LHTLRWLLLHTLLFLGLLDALRWLLLYTLLLLGLLHALRLLLLHTLLLLRWLGPLLLLSTLLLLLLLLLLNALRWFGLLCTLLLLGPLCVLLLGLLFRFLSVLLRRLRALLRFSPLLLLFLIALRISRNGQSCEQADRRGTRHTCESHVINSYRRMMQARRVPSWVAAGKCLRRRLFAGVHSAGLRPAIQSWTGENRCTARGTLCDRPWSLDAGSSSVN